MLCRPNWLWKNDTSQYIGGLDIPTEGEVFLNGQLVNETGPDRITVFQENALFPWLNVIDNVEF